MMSTHTKLHVPVGILYRWMYPTVNPYSCGVAVCLLACPRDSHSPYISQYHPTKTSALNEEYTQAAYIVHRQHTGEEVHGAHGPTALNSGI